MLHPDKIFGRLGNNMFQFAFIYSLVRTGVIPDIFIQNHEYFNRFRGELKDLFKVKSDPIDLVAVHVRRGDYVNNPFYVDLMKTDYYNWAMSQFPNDNFLIFSDDIEWCKKNSKFTGCKFSEEKTEIEDMGLMANCKGIIMANSSFSWWGAFLSDSKKVIAPKEWFTDKIERITYLNEWIKG